VVTDLATRPVDDPSSATAPAPGAPRAPGLLVRTWPALVPALVLAVVYGRTVQRGTGNAFSIDTTKFEFVGRVLGSPHPPGYPLYTMLNAAFVRVVPVGSTALLANLLSAVFALLTCVLAVSVLRSLGLSRALAAGGATALGMLPSLWRNAVVAEVYSLTALFMMAVLACVLRYERTQRPGWLRAGLLLFALSFAHATSDVLLFPGLLLYVLLRRPPWLLRPRELATLLPTGALLALLPYGYLWWRTAAGGNTWVETQVYDLHSLWGALTGAQFGNRMFMVTLDLVRSDRLPVLADTAAAQFGPLLVLAGAGLVVLALTRPLVAALSLVWVLATAGFVLTYAIDDWLTLLLPVWLVVALWALVGLDRLLAVLGPRAAGARVLVAVVLPVVALLHGFGQADRSGPDPQLAVDAAVAAVPNGSLVFAPTVEARQQFVYRLLLDDLGQRRRVWAAEGPNHSAEPDQAVFFLHEYCAFPQGRWMWPWHEQLAAPSVPRGLRTFVFGEAYAEQVGALGFPAAHVDGQLFSVSCPAADREGPPSAGAAMPR